MNQLEKEKRQKHILAEKVLTREIYINETRVQLRYILNDLESCAHYTEPDIKKSILKKVKQIRDMFEVPR